MATGKIGLLVHGAAWVALAVVSSACGGRAQPSSGEPQPPAQAGGSSSGSGSGSGRAEGVAGSVLNAVGGAGGSVVVMPPPAVTPSGGRGSSPDPTQPGDAGGAPGTVACAAGAPPLRAELQWQDIFYFYGSSDYPFIGFSPDGATLIVPIAESTSQGSRSYGVGSGELSVQPLPAILGRDAAWSRQLLSLPGTSFYFGGVAEIASGQPLLSPSTKITLGTDLARPLQVRLSDDGQYLFRLICDGGFQVERFRISDGEVARVLLGSGQSLCVGYGHPTFILPLSASRANDSVLVGAERRGFALADFARGSALFSVPPDDPAVAAERKPNQPLASDALTLELGPSERSVATIDASGTLRLLSYPELVQSSPAITTAVSSAFVRSYVTPRTLAPVAWSPDERYLATADDSHATVVRRACDGSIVVTLPPPVPDVAKPDDDQHWAPAFLAFNRQGLALAVLRVNERFRATVSYYELSVASQN